MPLTIITFNLFFSGALLHAQSTIPSAYAMLPSAPVPTISKNVSEVNLTFTVTDHRGHFIGNLNSSDFTIEDNGEPPARITYFESQTDLPLRIAVVLDHSSSVSYCLDFEKHAAMTFLKHMLRPASDLAVIVGFNEAVRVIGGPSSDQHFLSKAMGTIRAGGETAIFDAVSVASRELGKINDTETVRRAIILITDGDDNDSHINLKQAEETALQNESAVYVMSTSTISTKADSAQITMSELAESTGGFLFRASRDQALENALTKTGKGLRSQYVLGFTPAGVTSD